MKVLYILKQAPSVTAQKIIEEQKKIAEVNVVDMQKDKDYNQIITLVEQSDKVITW